MSVRLWATLADGQRVSIDYSKKSIRILWDKAIVDAAGKTLDSGDLGGGALHGIACRVSRNPFFGGLGSVDYSIPEKDNGEKAGKK